MHSFFGDVVIVRLLIQRGMAALYLVGFVVVLNQFKPLLGERGLLPVTEHMRGTDFRGRFSAAPGIFAWRYSDRLLDAVGWAGCILSMLALLGITERTASLHVNNAAHKLGCVNKHQAVLKALRLGLLR